MDHRIADDQTRPAGSARRVGIGGYDNRSGAHGQLLRGSIQMIHNADLNANKLALGFLAKERYRCPIDRDTGERPDSKGHCGFERGGRTQAGQWALRRGPTSRRRSTGPRSSKRSPYTDHIIAPVMLG